MKEMEDDLLNQESDLDNQVNDSEIHFIRGGQIAGLEEKKMNSVLEVLNLMCLWDIYI